jgi:hypothetical protein
MSLNGQWIGPFDSPHPGWMIVDVDDVGDRYIALAKLNPNDQQLPATAVALFIPKASPTFHLDDVKVFPVSPASGEPDVTDATQKAFPHITFPTSASVTGKWSDSELTLSWITNLGSDGRATLPRTRSSQPSEYPATTVGWEDYKATVNRFEGRRYIFRGQEKPWRLRTTFHRTGRANLDRFRTNDIPELQRHLSARTRHLFNFAVPDEYGAFLNLVQHHGYPTPLLDWTYSPYVAAFFAYRDLSHQQIADATKDDRVRVIVFDQKLWRESFNQRLQLISNREHFSMLDPLAIDNDRMIPQQAAVSVTNVDDIETYIRRCEELTTKSFIRMLDLPTAIRYDVMRELSFMGITAGALFPGIDGACEELRERHFQL